ncbi:MAG: hypothetical protein QM484_11025 [Woeseiaceae bacterium]
MIDTPLQTFIIDGIYDIQPLTQPPLSIIDWIALFFAVVLIVSSISYVVWKKLFSVKAKSIKQLKCLEKNFLNNTVSQHDFIYEMCHLLKQGFQYKALNENTPMPSDLSAQQPWHEFINSVSQARYQHATKTDSLKLLNQCFGWLRT